jgi:hypothetical protein
VIPARLGSSRLPRKPLLPIAGEPLIVRVVRRVAEQGLCDRLVVATDAEEIAAVVRRYGGEAVLTSPARIRTERVAEVAIAKSLDRFDHPQRRATNLVAQALAGSVRAYVGDPIGNCRAARRRAGCGSEPRQGGAGYDGAGPVLLPRPDPVRPGRDG